MQCYTQCALCWWKTCLSAKCHYWLNVYVKILSPLSVAELNWIPKFQQGHPYQGIKYRWDNGNSLFNIQSHFCSSHKSTFSPLLVAMLARSVHSTSSVQVCWLLPDQVALITQSSQYGLLPLWQHLIVWQVLHVDYKQRLCYFLEKPHLMLNNLCMVCRW